MADAPPYDAAAFKAFEHEGWQRVAATYLDAFGPATEQVGVRLLDAIGAGQGQRLLDVACGPGWLAALAAQRGAEVVGLDLVPAMVDEARRRYPGLEVRQGDAEALPFEDGAFNAVVCCCGILHFPAPGRAVAEAHRVLATGGAYALTAWCPPARSPLFALVYGTFQAHAELTEPVPAGPDLFRYGEPDACRELLEAAGFVDVEIREVPNLVHFEAPGGVMDMIVHGTARSAGVLERANPASRERIAAALAEGAGVYATADGVEIPMPAVLAVGRKP